MTKGGASVKKLKDLRRSEDGSALVMVLVAMTVLSMFGMVLWTYSNGSMDRTAFDANMIQADYDAHAGCEMAFALIEEKFVDLVERDFYLHGNFVDGFELVMGTYANEASDVVVIVSWDNAKTIKHPIAGQYLYASGEIRGVSNQHGLSYELRMLFEYTEDLGLVHIKTLR